VLPGADKSCSGNRSFESFSSSSNCRNAVSEEHSEKKSLEMSLVDLTDFQGVKQSLQNFYV
jgi:hypothetical protein